MPTTDPDDEVIVRSQLAQLGLAPTEPEISMLVAGYPAVRRMVAMLYAIPGVRYDEPATTFDPRIAP